MDIHVSDAHPTAEEKDAVDSVMGPPRSRWDGGERTNALDAHVAEGGHAARSQRHLLLPALHAINDRVGWISKGALNYVCERLTIPPAEAYGVASFYHMFSLEPRPKTVVYVCDDIACMCAGSDELCEDLEKTIGPAGTPYADGKATWVRSPCLGRCDKAPAALVSTRNGRQFSIEATTVEKVLDPSWAMVAPTTEARRVRSAETSVHQPAKDLRLLRRVLEKEASVPRTGTSRDALRKALDMGADRVLTEITESNLLGRGGAAFPAGRKWEAVAREPTRPHYIVCNADESEPGTFKDLFLMWSSPFDLIEAMTIAAFATSCEKGFIYVRGEYANAAARLETALDALRTTGGLGTDILGSGFAFDIEVHRGAGAYICGEETALFNSIEGYRGEPRNKPPFPVQRGLFGKPTIVNNVETLANIPGIILEGGKAYARIGTPESKGTRLFCLSGHAERSGVYEVPMGTTLRSLIDMAGGVRGGKKLQAVLLGGAAGTFLKPDEIDVPLSFEGVRAIKATLGSGVVMLFDETVDLRKIVARIARFFRDESCGQCVPCRVGTVRQEELLHRLAGSKPNAEVDGERKLLGEIGQAMRDASICGLGQTASSAIESALAKFDLYGGATG